METPYYSPAHHHDPSRPSLGFPLGTALLLIIVFSLSGIFSCCYHWEKLRSLRGAFPGASADDDSPTKPKLPNKDLNEKQNESLPVIMPGDRIPKFIAMPCPCRPFRAEEVIIQVQNPPKSPGPQIAVPL